MLSHRPTMLAADVWANNYFAHDKLMVTNLHNGKIVLLLWTSDSSVANRITSNITTIDRILSLIPMIVNVIERLPTFKKNRLSEQPQYRTYNFSCPRYHRMV
jgi:hypothetical protein